MIRAGIEERSTTSRSESGEVLARIPAPTTLARATIRPPGSELAHSLPRRAPPSLFCRGGLRICHRSRCTRRASNGQPKAPGPAADTARARTPHPTRQSRTATRTPPPPEAHVAIGRRRAVDAYLWASRAGERHARGGGRARQLHRPGRAEHGRASRPNAAASEGPKPITPLPCAVTRLRAPPGALRPDGASATLPETRASTSVCISTRTHAPSSVQHEHAHTHTRPQTYTPVRVQMRRCCTHTLAHIHVHNGLRERINYQK